MSKILVIDDDNTNLKLIQSGLQSKGFEVDVATDGDVGIEKVKQFVPDLIILDIQMPRLNGYNFLYELKKIRGRKKIPILVLTAHNEWEPIFRYNGVKDYMVKPIQFENLLEKINRCFQPDAPSVKPPIKSAGKSSGKSSGTSSGHDAVPPLDENFH